MNQKERDTTEKQKKKEIKIRENRAFSPLFHCPLLAFVTLCSLVIITIQAKNISKGEIKTILSAWLAVNKIFFVKALINLPFGRNPTYKFNKQ